jgi:hypothetical protein
VEEHTGKKAEELSDEELDRAMDDLNISKQELTDEEWEYVDAEDAKEDSAPVTSAPAGEPRRRCQGRFSACDQRSGR